MENSIDFKQRVLYRKRKVSIDILKTNGSGNILQAVVGNIRPEPCTDNEQFLYNGFYYDVYHTESIDFFQGEYTVKKTTYLKMLKVYNNGKLIYNYDRKIKNGFGIAKGVLNTRIVKSINLPSYFAEIFVVLDKYAPECVNKEAQLFLSELKKAKGVE